MSWLSDAWDGVSGFISDNKSIIKPIVGVGLGALNQSNADKSQSQYLDYLREKENQNYQASVDAITAYNAQGGGGGGGHGGGGAAAAAAANERARLAAAKKANKKEKKTYKKLLEMYAPYRAVADKLLPEMTQTYQNSLGLQSALGNFINQPEQMAKLNGSIPAFAVDVPLPDTIRMK
jgi:hypothetical protein